MPQGFRIDLHPIESGMVVRGDPVGIFTDPEGEAFIVTATPMEIEGEKTSVYEANSRGEAPLPD